MALSNKSKRVIDVIQWVLIGVLMFACAVVFFGNEKLKKERDRARDEVYVKIYESQSIEALKKKNKELYDSLQTANSRKPESALEIRYKYKFLTDTITKTKFVEVQPELEADSNFTVYHYESDNDTIQTKIDVMAQDLQWVNVNAVIHDKFTIINRVGTDGTVETTIGHSANTEIEHVDAWHRKKTWKDNLFIGPSVSAGYDPFNKQFGFLIGVSVGYNLWRK